MKYIARTALLLAALAAGLGSPPGAVGQVIDSAQVREDDAAPGPAGGTDSAAAPPIRTVRPGGDHVGLAITFLADLNHDRKSELVIGAYGNDSAEGDAGAAFVIAGSTGDTLLSLFGRNRHDNFGAAVAALDDLDGDAVPDFAVGAPGVNGEGDQLPDRGAVYLFSGADGHVLDSLYGDHPQGQYGYSLVALGDLDGDGTRDFAVGERRGGDSARPNFGTVFICSGRTRQTLHVLEGSQSGDRFGSAIAGIGDVDGDGTSDLIVGAYRYSTELPSVGAIYLVSGKTGATIRTQAGTAMLGQFGFAVAGMGDPDGSGEANSIIVGARFNDQAGGRAGRVVALRSDDLSVLRAFSGTPDAQFGTSLANVGDLDRDGRGDLAVGAPRADGSGAVYVFSGRDGQLLSTLSGDAPADHFGGTVVGGGDADGDGVPDLAVGALGSDDGGVDAGKVYVYSGRELTLLQTFRGLSGISAKDTARVARVIEAVRAINKAADTLVLPDTIYDSTQVDVMPILRRTVGAEYPSTALGSGLSGWVKLRILVLANGAPGKVEIEDDAGLGPDFRLAALTAARQWFFVPATKGGEAVAAWSVFPIGFAPEEVKRPEVADSTAGSEKTTTGSGATSDSAGTIAPGAGTSEPPVLDAGGTPPTVAISESMDSTDSIDSASASMKTLTSQPATADSVVPDTSGAGALEVPSGPEPTIEGSVEDTVAGVDSGSAVTSSGTVRVEVDLSRLYETTEVDVAPVITARFEPQYPAAARLAGDTCTVVLRLVVDTLGAVSRVDLKSCSVPGKGFEEAATAAARKWHFESAKKARQKVNCIVEYPLEFRI